MKKGIGWTPVHSKSSCRRKRDVPEVRSRSGPDHAEWCASDS
jgi:hypothetical protein